MSLHALPSIASPAQLFSDFVCSPVAMKGDAHLAIIRDFHGRMKTAEANPATLQSMVAAAASAQAGAEQQWPWEIPLYTVQEGIAFMQISGPLVKGYDDITCWYWRLASTDRISRELAEIDLRTDVHTVILLLKTPGGMAIGIPELGDQLVEMQSRRPVFAFSSDTFASAGYWIAAGCSSIFATKSACVGSIGTYIALYDYTAMLEEWGIKLELFRQGIYKGLGLMGKPLTDEERT
ncbi:MAG: sppA 1, partial [Rariglobus sp.]|nr:sppA 1 [Rariglobus sp.]